MQTIRIYFEYGTKAVGLSGWQKIWNNRLANQLMKLCKENDMRQAIFFNVRNGYLDRQAIQWGIGEIPSPKHPQCMEITDSKEKISHFVEQLQPLLSATKILAIEKQELINYEL